MANEQLVLLERTPSVQDVPSAWLLLSHCASVRANCQFRSVPPDAIALFAAVPCVTSLEVVVVGFSLFGGPGGCERAGNIASCDK